MKQFFIGKDKFKTNEGKAKAKVIFTTPKSPYSRFGLYDCWKELGELDEEDKKFFFRYELGLGFISILWG